MMTGMVHGMEDADMGLEFKEDIPDVIGVYIVVEADRYETFMNNPNATRLNGFREVFVKLGAEGKFYATGDGFNLTEDEFERYVWARRCDFN